MIAQPNCKITDGSEMVEYPCDLNDEIRTELWGLPLISQPEVIVFGKVRHQRRDVQFFSDDVSSYTYSGKSHQSLKLTPTLCKILSAVNELFHEQYNGILVNRYNNGEDYIGAHHDDEKELGQTGIVTLSLGATRTLRFKCPGLSHIDHKLKDGTLFWFSNAINKKYTHEIPKSKLIKSPRLSLTFRNHKG